MNARQVLLRAPFVLALALVLTFLGAGSTLAKLLPIDLATFPGALWLFLALVAALTPAWLAREAPLPYAALAVVPVLAAGAYGASRLDWLRVLKDFDVAEENALSPLRLALGVVALALLWALHAADLAMRLRERAVERGIEAEQAAAASQRVVRRSAEASGIALAGTLGLVLVGIGGIYLGTIVPTERAALVAPLVAALVLVAAAVWVARGSVNEGQ